MAHNSPAMGYCLSTLQAMRWAVHCKGSGLQISHGDQGCHLCPLLEIWAAQET